MKAVRFHEFGDAGVLRYEDADPALPGPGEALVRVAATSFNPVDAGIRGGFLRDAIPVTLPHVPGIDVAGTIAGVGSGVTIRRSGDRVVGSLSMVVDGAAADYVIAPAESLAEVPPGIPLTDVAALPLVGLTAWQSLFEVADLRAGQTLLVNGAGGAVGGYAVQLAKHAGARVIAMVGPRSAERARRAGADRIIDYTTTRVPDAVSEPVDAVLNTARITPAALTALARLVRPGGVLVTTVPTVRPDEVDGVRSVAVFVRNDPGQLVKLLAMVDAGDLELGVTERLPLTELSTVHARSDAGELSGKVVLLPAA